MINLPLNYIWLPLIGFIPIAYYTVQSWKTKNFSLGSFLKILGGALVLFLSINDGCNNGKDQQIASTKHTKDSANIESIKLQDSSLSIKLDSANNFLKILYSKGLKRNPSTNTPVFTKNFVQYVTFVTNNNTTISRTDTTWQMHLDAADMDSIKNISVDYLITVYYNSDYQTTAYAKELINKLKFLGYKIVHTESDNLGFGDGKGHFRYFKYKDKKTAFFNITQYSQPI